jgi:succinate dehydrogenase / fumarate reductase, cytochrome b subunit
VNNTTNPSSNPSSNPTTSSAHSSESTPINTSFTRKRPVNLDIGTITFPAAAIASLLHRISGVALVVGVGILMWLLDWSLADEESFNTVKNLFDSPICKLIVWGVLAFMIYHTAAGIRHLFMDVGVGESLEGGRQSARIVFIVTVVLVVLVGAFIW